MKWSCRASNILICNLILSLFGVIVVIFMRSSIIFLRNLSFNWSKLLIFLNLFSRLNLCFKIHFICVYRGVLLWIRKIFRLKGRMMNNDRVCFLLNFRNLWWYLIRINRLSSHLHCFIFLWWLFWVSIYINTVYVLLNLLNHISILIGILSSISVIYFIEMLYIRCCFDSCIFLFCSELFGHFLTLFFAIQPLSNAFDLAIYFLHLLQLHRCYNGTLRFNWMITIFHVIYLRHSLFCLMRLHLLFIIIIKA